MKANHTQVDNELDLFNMMQDADNKSDSECNHAKMVNYRSDTTFDEERLGQQDDVQLVEKEIIEDAMAEGMPKEKEKAEMEYTVYPTDQVKAAAKEYFHGDALAGDVWANKYALKDSDGNIYELTPDEMHRRIAREIARIEKKYPNPLREEEIYEILICLIVKKIMTS